ncbi:MAG: hypothetical protein Q7S16_04660, partial [bacterium]|nr:hypothetical protein [bacterium]
SRVSEISRAGCEEDCGGDDTEGDEEKFMTMLRGPATLHPHPTASVKGPAGVRWGTPSACHPFAILHKVMGKKI